MRLGGCDSEAGSHHALSPSVFLPVCLSPAPPPALASPRSCSRVQPGAWLGWELGRAQGCEGRSVVDRPLTQRPRPVREELRAGWGRSWQGSNQASSRRLRSDCWGHRAGEGVAGEGCCGGGRCQAAARDGADLGTPPPAHEVPLCSPVSCALRDG